MAHIMNNKIIMSMDEYTALHKKNMTSYVEQPTTPPTNQKAFIQPDGFFISSAAFPIMIQTVGLGFIFVAAWLKLRHRTENIEKQIEKDERNIENHEVRITNIETEVTKYATKESLTATKTGLEQVKHFLKTVDNMEIP
jgi:hypothetical protein